MVNKPWLATPHSFTLNMTDGIQKRKEFGRKYGVVVSASGHQPQLLAQICDLTPVTPPYQASFFLYFKPSMALLLQIK